MNEAVRDSLYRCPSELSITSTELRRVLMIGSCLAASWPNCIKGATPGCPCDFIVVNNRARLPETLSEPVDSYDFQMIQIPLRMILPEYSYFRLSYTDSGAYEELLVAARQRIADSLSSLMKWNVEHGLLTFVFNFLLPQQNPMGRLFPRYDLRNFIYFVEKLNEALTHELAHYQNTYLFDFDQVVSTLGRRLFQDDAVLHLSHGAALSAADFQRDRERLEPVTPVGNTYPYRNRAYIYAGWYEIVAMYRSIRQLDLVKLVIVDIDDTLWRGVAAEGVEISPDLIEGWPLGFIEALAYLKKRGVLLAVVSKNEEGIVTELWPKILDGKLNLEDFVVRKINWRPKVENVEELLTELQLLPRNVVFIDDNPREREAVRAAFPEIRTFGPNPYLWRRVLLWSAETQTAGLTSEAAARTEMVRAQIERETQRKKVSPEEFLATLDVRVTLSFIDNIEENSFARALELINKTNQFNTTARRWTAQQCRAAFAQGTRFLIFKARDRFTDYGIVGVVIKQSARLEQFVMSCRVIGMDIEIAVMSELLRLDHNKSEPIVALLRHTGLNLVCRDLYRRCGFERSTADMWTRERMPVLSSPPHVKLCWETVHASNSLEAGHGFAPPKSAGAPASP